MKMRRIDTNGDIHFGYGDSDFISDSAQTVAQKVVQRLRLWEGEWFLDISAGTPWQEGLRQMRFRVPTRSSAPATPWPWPWWTG